MPRRWAPGGLIYHVMNRAVSGTLLFESPQDYKAFEAALAEACRHVPMRILAYCLMPNHWHLVLWPYEDGDLARFMHWLTTTHARRWREFRETNGRGHVYQGRFKSIAVEDGDYLVTLLRYVERNALRAGLVSAAELWRWCSLWRRLHPDVGPDLPALSEWPQGIRPDWIEYVNTPISADELNAIRRSIARGLPFGSADWQKKVAKETSRAP